jgi:hypothetical protein
MICGEMVAVAVPWNVSVEAMAGCDAGGVDEAPVPQLESKNSPASKTINVRFMACRSD